MGDISTYHVEFIDGETRVPFTSTSTVLREDKYHSASATHFISGAAAEVYGNPQGPRGVRVGNGGLGPIGLLRELCSAYVSIQPQYLEKKAPSEFKIDWVANHSRYTQAALQAGVVDVALTYEREEEDKAEREGWSKRVGILLHDHFIIAGPVNDPAGLRKLGQPRNTVRGSQSGNIAVTPAISPAAAFKSIADTQSLFHTRGDGSATMHREHALWSEAGISLDGTGWYNRIPGTPLEALRRANADGAYLLTDRATFLFALNAGDVGNMDVFVEGGEEMLNTCSILVRPNESKKEIGQLVNWLMGQEAQGIIERYGKDWPAGLPLVTPASQVEMSPGDELAGRFNKKHVEQTRRTTIPRFPAARISKL